VLKKILLANEKSDSFLKFALDVNDALWIDGEAAIAKFEQEVGRVSDEQREHLVQKSQNILKSKGHYLSATLFYGGEWYWGADRILHLAQRLNGLNISKTKVDLSQYDYPILPDSSEKNKKSDTKTLDFYFSFRSPYSYLACQRLQKLKNKADFKINIKPVLPMVMRGLPVPSAKKIYIFLDTKRECERYHVPFGKTVDPLGEGVNRSMAIFPYAQKIGLELEYISSVSKGIWAEGKDVTQNDALEQLTERAGLNWSQALPYLEDKRWEENAEKNRKDMIACGFWGVPTFQYGKESFWGQDRLWAIEKLINS
jgi:2-hydroxychromene-2-carboxylate isomerase